MKSQYDFSNAKRGPVIADQAFVQSDPEFGLDTLPNFCPETLERYLASVPKVPVDPAIEFARGYVAAHSYPIDVFKKQ